MDQSSLATEILPHDPGNQCRADEKSSLGDIVAASEPLPSPGQNRYVNSKNLSVPREEAPWRRSGINEALPAADLLPDFKLLQVSTHLRDGSFVVKAFDASHARPNAPTEGQ